MPLFFSSKKGNSSNNNKSKEDLASHKEDINSVKQSNTAMFENMCNEMQSNFRWIMGTVITGIIMCLAIYGSLLYFFTR